ncbi:MAG: hypothetical protein E6R03_14630 [Hyphomicrobiaceae bacterium]|nr:MAG: hypothetical protein E6R03_14630 [Hyphomicrobiaceae bacterium]
MATEQNLPTFKELDWLGTNQELAAQLAKDHPGRCFRFVETRPGRFKVTVLPEGMDFDGPPGKIRDQSVEKDKEKLAGVLYGTIVHHGQAYRIYGPEKTRDGMVKDLLTSGVDIHMYWFGPDIRIERV